MTAQDQNKELLRAGAYLLPGAKLSKDVHTDGIDVRVYTHPALGERTVARLTPTNLALGEDNAMGFFGFGAPTVTKKVAKRARQALGFPEWVLVHDPKNAQRALEISKKLKKAARRAKSKPGHAKDDFDAMGQELSKKLPHFIPSYYEEVARAFLEAGNTSYAASSFGKAREAEKVYALEVDEDRRRAAFLEFALAGALTNKVMTEYAGDLSQRHGPEKAYEYFIDLATRRTLGGTPPHAQMIAQLRKLAKAAGLKQADEDQRFLGEIWESPSVNKAPKKYWDVYKKAYIALAKKRPEIRGRLINTFPSPSGKATGFKESWIAFLEDAGALESVTHPDANAIAEEARVEDNAAAWYAQMLQHSMDGGYYWNRSALPDAMFGLLRSLEARLKADEIPLQFDTKSGWHSSVDIELLDLALELGIESLPLEYSSFELGKWASPDEESEERPRDLRFVGADDRFENDLDSAVGSVFGDATFQQAAVGCEGLESARRRWLERRSEQFGNLGLPSLFANIGELKSNTSPSVFKEFPEAYEQLNQSDPIGALTRTFNLGLVDEFTWPAFEEAYKELWGEKQDADVNIEGVYPYLILRNDQKAIVVGAERVLEHDFQLPKGKNPRQLRYSQGQLIVIFYNDSWDLTGYWSGNPKNQFEVERYPGGGSVAVELADGSITEGSRALKAGDATPAQGHEMVSDGETFWERKGYWNDLSFEEYNPETGEKGRSSLPAFYEDFARTDYKVQLGSSVLYPLPKGVDSSVLGSKDGLYGWRQREHTDETKRDRERIDGHFYSGTGSPGALAAFPGSDILRSVTSGCVYDYDEDLRGDDDYSAHHLDKLGLPFWHFFKARDEAGSKMLRELDEDTVRALLAPAIIENLNEAMPAMHGGSAYLGTLLESLGAQLVARSDEATNKVLEPAIAGYVTWLNGGDKPSTIEGEALLNDVLANAMAGVATSFTDSIKSVLSLAAERICSYGRMLTDNHPENAGAVGAGPGLVDGDISDALSPIGGYRSYYYGSDNTEIVPQMELISNYLRTGEVTGQLQGMKLRFHQFLGRPGIIAYWAIARGTDAKHRESLLAFLRAWKDTGLTEMGGKVRVMYGNADKEIYGESAMWLRSFEGKSRYWGITRETWNELTVDIIEYNEDGVFELPDGFTITESWTVPASHWGSADEIEAFLAAVEAAEDAVLPLEKDGLEALAEKTGMTYGEAAIFWSGLPNVSSWETNFLPKELRTELGLKVKEADVGRQTLRSFDHGKLMNIFDDVIPDDPTQLFVATEEWDESHVIGRLAAGWNEEMGQRLSLPEDLLIQLDKEMGMGSHEARMLLTAALAPPAEDSPFGVDVKNQIKAAEEDAYDPFEIVNFQSGFTLDTMRSAAKLIAYMSGSVPVGDSVRNGLPSLYDLALERLGNAELILNLGSEYIDSEDKNAQRDFLDSIGQVTQLGKSEFVDAGFILAIPGRWNTGVYFRPALRLKGESHPYYERIAEQASGYYNTVPHLERFLSDTFKAMVDRIRETPLEADQYESNPLHSAPHVVKAIGAKHDVNEDAAVLYAQTLALHNPTTKFVRLWNDWTAGRYKKAVTMLADQGLLIEAKRARAGRKHFLPGGWEALKKPDLPIETWKLSLYDVADSPPMGQILPLRPVHQLFEDAWNRIESGDLPSF